MKAFNEIRDLGEILLDPIKIIFRNLKPLTGILILSVMLPNFGLNYFYLNDFVQNIFSGNSAFILPFAIVFLCLTLIYLHLSLISASLLRVGIEDGQKNITSKRLAYYFRKLYWRNLAVSSLFIIILFVVVGSCVLLIFNEMFVGFFLMLIFFLGIFFYLYPLFLYTQRRYLLEDELTLGQAFKHAQSDLSDYYGMTIGTIFISSLVSSFLQYMILIPFGILTFVLATAIEFDFEGSSYSIYILIIQSLFLSVGLSYLYLYMYLAVYMKNLDIAERKTGKVTMEKIKQISFTKETFFENEGEY